MLTKEARQILIHFNAWRRGQSDAPEMPDPKESGKAIDVAIEAMGAAWISVEDRLPPEGIDTLVFGSDGINISCYGELGSYFGKRAKEMGWGDGQDEQPGTLHVTHWQPLPSPPNTK